jgi:ABC-type antimicrobial peptide transport system permease subunit
VQPHVQIFLKQTRRSTKRLALQLVLLCAVTVFFVVSLNLYCNSRSNLLAVEDAYKTIATMEIYGDVNKKGELVNPGDETFVGRYLLSPEDFDLSTVLNLPGVIGYDLRPRYVAYLPDEVLALDITNKEDSYPAGYIELVGCDDVLRFTINSETPIEIPIVVDQEELHHSSGLIVDIPIHLLDQTLPHIVYEETIRLEAPRLWPQEMEHHASDIQQLNRSDRTDVIILYPDVEYVLAGYFSAYFAKNDANGKYLFKTNKGVAGSGALKIFTMTDLSSYLKSALEYTNEAVNGYVFSVSSLIKEGAPYRMQRYEDVKDDPEWARTVESIEYTNYSMPLTLTNDIRNIPAWYKGGMYLQEGRMITAEEYASGAQVCMISAKTAEYQGWKIGDTLNMQCYDFDGFYDKTGTRELTAPWYYRGLEGFFHTGEYEIVGIFGQSEVTDMGDTAEEVFYQPWNTIYIPTNSVENAPDDPIQPSTLTILLENGSIDAFKAAVEKLGLTEQKTGQYQLKFSYFDQGYDKIAGGLDEMNRNAKILLGLSAALLLVTMVLTAFLFSRQHKHSAGILRMLGGSKKQAFTAILACAAAVVTAGGIVGTVLGGVLTQSVGASTLGDAVESAKVALSTGASPLLTALTGIACMALFLLLTAIFTGMYIGKEPRALLPEDKN